MADTRWNPLMSLFGDVFGPQQSPITGGPMYYPAGVSNPSPNVQPAPTTAAETMQNVMQQYNDPAMRGVGVNTVLGFTESPAAVKLQSTGRAAIGKDMWGDKYSSHNFNLVDNGENLGSLYVKRFHGAPDAMVNVWGAGENTLGPRAMRETLTALKKRFPDLEEIYGQRISGARKAAGDTAQTVRMRIRPRAAGEPE
jgi:hypothetical protein